MLVQFQSRRTKQGLEAKESLRGSEFLLSTVCVLSRTEAAPFLQVVTAAGFVLAFP